MPDTVDVKTRRVVDSVNSINGLLTSLGSQFSLLVNSIEELLSEMESLKMRVKDLEDKCGNGGGEE